MESFQVLPSAAEWQPSQSVARSESTGSSPWYWGLPFWLLCMVWQLAHGPETFADAGAERNTAVKAETLLSG
jgi:hypothetical protein